MAYVSYNNRGSKPKPELKDFALDFAAIDNPQTNPGEGEAEETFLDPEADPTNPKNLDTPKDINPNKFYSEKYRTVNQINAIKKDLPPKEKAEKINTMEKEMIFAQQRMSEIAQPENYAYHTGAPQGRPKSKRRKRKKHKLLAIFLAGIGISLITILALALIYCLYCYFFNKNVQANVIMPALIYILGVAAGSSFVSNMVRQRSLLPALMIAGSFWLASMIITYFYASLGEFKISYILIKLLLTFLASFFGFIISLIPNILTNKKRAKNRRQLRNSKNQFKTLN